MKILLKWKKWQIKFYRCPIGDVSVWDILRDFGDGLEKNWGQTRNPSKCPKQKRPQLDKIKVGDVYAT